MKHCYRLKEFVQVFPAVGSVSRLYQLIRDGEIAAKKSGKLTVIERAEGERYVNSLPSWQPWQPPKSKPAA